jgi:predicted metal-dependent peptidase
MATDGREILYSCEFVEKLSPQELEGTLAHEVMHCALGHHCRRGERDPALWNQAADLAINPLLVANGLTLPAGALIEPALASLSAEEIYSKLEQRNRQEQKNSNQPSAGGGTEDRTQPDTNQPQKNGAADSNRPSRRPGGFGEVIDCKNEKGETASAAESAQQQKEWSIAAEQAMRSAAGCGRETAGIARPLKESRHSPQDWRAILRDFVVAQAPSDYCWSPPNRRFVASGLYLPSVERRQVGSVVIAVDTSGSISEAELDKFAAEINAIAEDVQPESVRVIYCDSRVAGVEEFSAGERVELNPRGGGGTDFRPVFSWIEQEGLEPACVVYLTDLACPWFPQAPAYPVLWVTESRRSAPFGETIRMIGD